jgi:hypothetical protein
MDIRNAPVLKPWKKLGYTILPYTPDVGGICSVHAISPTTDKYRLWLVMDSGRLIRALVMRAPVKPKRAWRAIDACDGTDWSKVPAAWLAGKVEQILSEVTTDGDEEKAKARG